MLNGLLVDLVPYDQDFAALMLDWVNGPMGEWWGRDGLLSQVTHARNQDWSTPDLPPDLRPVVFGIKVKDGTPIGSVSVFKISAPHGHAEVGAGIGDPAYWSGGFGSDTTLLTVEYAFDWLGLRRLFLTTRGDNVRAQRQVEKCGWTLECVQRAKNRTGRGVEVDTLVYGLLRDEWPGYAIMAQRLNLQDKARQRAYIE